MRRQKWPGSIQAARQIFQFFKIPYKIRLHSDSGGALFEGTIKTKTGKKILVLICYPANTEFGIQFREPKTFKDMGGVFLHKCQKITWHNDEKHDHRVEIATLSSFSITSLSRWGIHTEIML